MIFTEVLIAVVIIASAWLFTVQQFKQLNNFRTMEQGLQTIRRLKPALSHLPQHRGMASALLNGDQTFATKTKEMQQKIEQDIVEIDNQLKSAPLSDYLEDHWNGIKAEWSSLKHDLHKINANESFERHSSLITRLINLIGDIADESNIICHPDADIRQIANTTFNTLPIIIEATGQARGIGSGAAAKGHLQTAVRIKLEFLVQRLKQAAQMVHNSLQHSNTDLSASQSSTQAFLDTVNRQILGAKVSITAADYFANGSMAFDSNFNLFETLSDKIDTMLTAQIAHTTGRCKLTVLTSLAISVILTVALY